MNVFILLPAAILSVLTPEMQSPSPSAIVVEGDRSASAQERWTITPDAVLERRYGARPGNPLNQVRVQF